MRNRKIDPAETMKVVQAINAKLESGGVGSPRARRETDPADQQGGAGLEERLEEGDSWADPS